MAKPEKARIGDRDVKIYRDESLRSGQWIMLSGEAARQYEKAVEIQERIKKSMYGHGDAE